MGVMVVRRSSLGEPANTVKAPRGEINYGEGWQPFTGFFPSLPEAAQAAWFAVHIDGNFCREIYVPRAEGPVPFSGQLREYLQDLDVLHALTGHR